MRSLIVLCLALTACSKSAEDPARSLVREIPASSITQAFALVEEAKLSCADEAQCPESVGLLLSASFDSVSSCTSFLIGPDLLATNSHCIPSAVKSLPDLCAERVEVIFPAQSGKPEERLACAELLLTSARPNAISPDLALIRLEKKSARAPFPFSRAGVNPDILHRAFKINPGKGASGTLVAQTCTPAANSYRFPLYRFASDPIFLVGDCPSLPGNSGAPLVNAQGQVVGLFQADLPLSSMQREVWGQHLLPGEDFAPLALGTNMNCLTPDLKLNPVCAPLDEEEIERPRIEDFDAALHGIPSLPPSPFQWERVAVRSRTLERSETLRPACFLNAPEGEKEITLQLELPTLRAKVFFNRYLQTSAKLEVTGTETRSFSLLPQQLREFGHAWVNEEEREISFCSND